MLAPVRLAKMNIFNALNPWQISNSCPIKRGIDVFATRGRRQTAEILMARLRDFDLAKVAPSKSSDFANNKVRCLARVCLKSQQEKVLKAVIGRPHKLLNY